MQTVLIVVHLLIAIALISVVLLQRSEGGALGMGGGGSGAGFGGMFSPRGAANTLTRTTAILAVLFLVTSMALTYFSLGASQQNSLFGAAPGAVPTLPSEGPPSLPAAGPPSLPGATPAADAAPANAAPVDSAPADVPAGPPELPAN